MHNLKELPYALTNFGMKRRDQLLLWLTICYSLWDFPPYRNRSEVPWAKSEHIRKLVYIFSKKKKPTTRWPLSSSARAPTFRSKWKHLPTSVGINRTHLLTDWLTKAEGGLWFIALAHTAFSTNYQEELDTVHFNLVQINSFIPALKNRTCNKYKEREQGELCWTLSCWAQFFS